MSDFWDVVRSLYIPRIRGIRRIQYALDGRGKQVIPDSVYASPKKLNLGSGRNPLPTYVNVDVLEERKPDIVSDITKLDFAADNEYDLVRASHVLEHFPLERIPDLVTEWRRVLRVGGYMVVCAPNYRALSWRAILSPSGFKLDESTYKNGWIYGLYALDLPPPYRHQIVFTAQSLTDLLNSLGLKVVGRLNYRKEHPLTLGIRDDSCTPFSINVAAVKI